MSRSYNFLQRRVPTGILKMPEIDSPSKRYAFAVGQVVADIAKREGKSDPVAELAGRLAHDIVLQADLLGERRLREAARYQEDKDQVNPLLQLPECRTLSRKTLNEWLMAYDEVAATRSFFTRGEPAEVNKLLTALREISNPELSERSRMFTD